MFDVIFGQNLKPYVWSSQHRLEWK